MRGNLSAQANDRVGATRRGLITAEHSDVLARRRQPTGLNPLRTVSIALVGLSLCACTSSPSAALPAGMSLPADSTIGVLHEAWASGDWPAWRGAFAADARIEFNDTGPLTVFAAADLQRRQLQPLAAWAVPAPETIFAAPDSQGRLWSHYRTRWSFQFAGSATAVTVPASVSLRIDDTGITDFRMDWDTLPYVLAAAAMAGDKDLDILLAPAATDTNVDLENSDDQ